MYRLEKNSPISNVVRNIQDFFPNTLESGKIFVFTFAMSSIIVATTYHPALQPSLESIRGGMGFVMGIATTVTLCNMISNFKKEKSRWLELGKQIMKEKEKKQLQERASMSQFLTTEQIMMAQLTSGDKVTPINLFQDNADSSSGGRKEDIGFSKVLQFPGR